MGRMTPMFIREPFWNFTYQLPQAYYVAVNPKDACMPEELEGNGTIIYEDIAAVLRDTLSLRNASKEERNAVS